MNAFWIFIGLIAISMPHFVAGGTGVAWPATPFATECALILTALALATTCQSPRMTRILTIISLATNVTTVIFEALCVIGYTGEVVPTALILVELILHSTNIASWLAYAILRSTDSYLQQEGRSQVTGSLIVVSLAAALAGFMWFILSHIAIERQNIHVNPAMIEPTLWLACVLWAAPLLILVWSLDMDAQSSALISAAPFAGVFLGNRVSYILEYLGMLPFFSVNPGILLALPAIFSMGTFCIAWLAYKNSVDEVISDSPNTVSEKPVLPSTKLPIYQLSGYSLLTERECQVVDASMAGATTEEIAFALSLATGTVSTYRSRAFTKLGVSSTQELLSVACELLQHPRLFIQATVQPSEGDSEVGEDSSMQNMPALFQTIPERFIPPVFCVACAVLILILTCLVRLLPHASAPTLVLCTIGVVLMVCSIFNASPSNNVYELLAALFIGTAFALSVCSILLGPALFFVRRLTIVGIIAATAAWCIWKSRGLWHGIVLESLGVCGLVFMAMAPQSALGQSLTRTPALFLVSALFLLAAAFVAQRANDNKASQIASVVLEGDERIHAYLFGRGLPDLQAQVILLTARGFSQSSIASSLCITRATVKEYRARAYKALGVHGKDQLIELLRVEAGL